MTYFCRTFFALAIFSCAVAQATPVIIDSFAVTAHSAIVFPPLFPSNPANSGTATAVGESLGGFRNIEVERLTGSGLNFVSVSAPNFDLNLAAGDTGVGHITWDGNDNNTLEHLLAADLTSLGTNTQIQMGVRSDLTGAITLFIYSGAGNFSTASVATPALGFGATPFTIYTLPFTGFIVGGGAGADFTNVSAIRLLADGSAISSAGLDLQLSFIEANGVPEPGTFALTGLALCGLAAIRFRGKR